MALTRKILRPLYCSVVASALTGALTGGGFEHRLTANTSIKAEYSYLDFDEETYNYISGLIVALPTQSRGGSDAHVVKVGLNYHF